MTTVFGRWMTVLFGVLALCLAGCAAPVAGEPSRPTTACQASVGPLDAPQDPAGNAQPLLEVSQGSNGWVGNRLTEPPAIAVYPGGTAITLQGFGAEGSGAEGSGTEGSGAEGSEPGESGALDEPLPTMRIGRLDGCQVASAVDTLVALRNRDFGDPAITDQGFTDVRYQPADGGEPIRFGVYALGLGDEGVSSPQQEARRELAGMIRSLANGVQSSREWLPSRYAIFALDRPADDGSVVLDWPLRRSLSETLLQLQGAVPCGEAEGQEAAALRDALGEGPALSTWTDGTRQATLALAVLVPGAPACGRG